MKEVNTSNRTRTKTTQEKTDKERKRYTHDKKAQDSRYHKQHERDKDNRFKKKGKFYLDKSKCSHIKGLSSKRKNLQFLQEAKSLYESLHQTAETDS